MNDSEWLTDKCIFINKFLRIGEWYDSKVPFLMCYTYIGMMAGYAMNTVEMYAKWISSFIFCSLFLAYGYLINDYADRDVDRQAGKKKVIYDMSEGRIRVSLVMVIVLAVLPVWAASGFSSYVLFMAIITVFLGGSYSMPPFRFKERGVMGLIVSSVAQRCMPVLVLSGLFPVSHTLTGVFLICSLLSGMRYIFIHQVIDLENDRKSGVHTFAEKNYETCVIGIYTVFVLEIISMAILLMMLHRPEVYVLLIPAFMLEFMACRAIHDCMAKPVFTTFYCVPGEAFYNIYLPLVLVLLVSVGQLRMIPVAVITCAYLYRPCAKKIKLVGLFIKSRVGKRDSISENK